MASTQIYPVFSVEDYLEYERVGSVYRVAGEGAKHSTICFNLYAITGNESRGKPCRGFSPNMKVATNNQSLYAYPDLAVVCGQPEYHDERCDVLLNPTVIYEILSPATEYYDRVEKFLLYTNFIATLQDYVLISQDYPLIEHYLKQSNGSWHKSETEGINSVFQIQSNVKFLSPNFTIW
jgi:Uma2 family endonuclease